MGTNTLRTTLKVKNFFFYLRRQFFIYMLVGFIFSLSKDLLPTYDIPGTMLDTGH